MRGRWLLVASFAASAISCRCGRAGGSAGAADADVDAGAPAVVTLARDIQRPAGIGVDARYVYFSTLFQGSFRVPRTGGPAERAPMKRDPRHAYWDAMFKLQDASDGTATYELGASAITRHEGGRSRELARSFHAGNLLHKALVADGDRLYWTEPRANAVLSVPKAGGPVSFVCELFVAGFEDLAVHGDRLYVLDIDGSLSSVPKTGGTRTFDATFWAELGENRNGLWVAAEPDGLYVASDATGSVVNGEVRFDGRVVRIAYPSPGRTVLADRWEGLVFATGIPFESDDAPRLSALDALRGELGPLADELGRGKWPLRLVIGAAPPARGRAQARASKVAEAAKRALGAGLRTEIVVNPPPAGTDPGYIGPSVFVGIARELVGAVFAPQPSRDGL